MQGKAIHTALATILTLARQPTLSGVAINNARLLSHITFTSTVEWVDLVFRRSGRYGLIVDLSKHHFTAEYFKRCACPDMLSRVYEHRDRWEEVRFGASFLPKERKNIRS
jgi:hypothetical protein